MENYNIINSCNNNNNNNNNNSANNSLTNNRTKIITNSNTSNNNININNNSNSNSNSNNNSNNRNKLLFNITSASLLIPSSNYFSTSTRSSSSTNSNTNNNTTRNFYQQLRKSSTSKSSNTSSIVGKNNKNLVILPVKSSYSTTSSSSPSNSASENLNINRTNTTTINTSSNNSNNNNNNNNNSDLAYLKHIESYYSTSSTDSTTSSLCSTESFSSVSFNKLNSTSTKSKLSELLISNENKLNNSSIISNENDYKNNFNVQSILIENDEDNNINNSNCYKSKIYLTNSSNNSINIKSNKQQNSDNINRIEITYNNNNNNNNHQDTKDKNKTSKKNLIPINLIKSNSFKLNSDFTCESNQSQNSFKLNNHETTTSNTKNSPLFFLKKKISSSNSFQNKLNLSTKSKQDLTQPENNNNNNNNPSDTALSKIKRTMSTSLNVANINKFIEPKLTLDASSTYQTPGFPVSSSTQPLQSYRSTLKVGQLKHENSNLDLNKNNKEEMQLDSQIGTHSAADLYNLSNNSKRWRSMYAIRDSIRNLTSCVSSKHNLSNKKNAPFVKVNTNQNSLRKNAGYLDTDNQSESDNGGFDEDYKSYNDENQLNRTIITIDSDYDKSTDYIPHIFINSRKENSLKLTNNNGNSNLNSANNYIGTSASYSKCVTSDNIFLANNRLNNECVGNASKILSSFFVGYNDYDQIKYEDKNSLKLSSSSQLDQNMVIKDSYKKDSNCNKLSEFYINSSKDDSSIYLNSNKEHSSLATTTTGFFSTNSNTNNLSYDSLANSSSYFNSNSISSQITSQHQQQQQQQQQQQSANEKTTVKKIKIKKKKNLFKQNQKTNENFQQQQQHYQHQIEIAPLNNEITSDLNTLNSSNKQQQQQQQQEKTLDLTVSSSYDKDALCDMIEKIQGDRLDNQRCELSQDYSVTKFFDKLPISVNQTEVHLNQSSKSNEKMSINSRLMNKQTTSERLVKILNGYYSISNDDINNNNARLYPMISLPENDNYWSEGWKFPFSDDGHYSNNDDLVISSSSLSSPLSTSSSSSPSPSPSTQSSSFTNNKINTISCFDFDTVTELSYRDSFVGKDNLIFFGRNSFDVPFVLSYKTESLDYGEFIRAILRTRETNYFTTIPLTVLDEPITPQKIIKSINPDFQIKNIYPLVFLNGFKLIKDFDNHTVNKTFKFGVIYMKKGQTTEEELFSNQEHSESFDEFLNLLGKRTKLKDFTGFRGGLDTVHGQTGEYSIYENYQDKEIMFHVSTLLPYNKNDSQQLERKRHIGNDIVAIVFQEDNTPFAPDMIASNFLHVFIVVQKFTDETSLKTKYRISVTARKDVPNFGPPISNDSIYENDSNLKEWLLKKLINAEYSCYKAEKFKKLKERTRASLLDNLYNDLVNQNQPVLNSMFPNSNLFSNTELSHSNNSSSSQFIDSSLSSRMYNPELIKGSHGSPLLSTNTSSSNNINNSTSFKFNLINTVRKAFRSKDQKEQKEIGGSRGSLTKTRSSTSSTLPLVAQQTSPLSENDNTNNIINNLNTRENLHSINEINSYTLSQLALKPTSRMRSSTFDTSTANDMSSMYFKQHIKPQMLIQEEQLSKKSNRKESKSEKKPKPKYENIQIPKIGSVDSLNNIENHPNKKSLLMNTELKSKLLAAIPPKNNTNTSLTDLSHFNANFMNQINHSNSSNNSNNNNNNNNNSNLNSQHLSSHDKSYVSSSASSSLPEDELDDPDSIHNENKPIDIQNHV